MATEDELPDELDKLEITPVLPQIKLLDSNLPLALNPFFENDILKDNTTGVNTEQPSTSSSAAPSLSSPTTDAREMVKCRRRRASESLLDSLKCSPSSVKLEVLDSCKHKPFKRTLRKSTGEPGNHKIVLREPILKALQTCLHPHSIGRQKLLNAATITGSQGNQDGPLAAKGMSDFRDLIEECRNLLNEDVDFSGRLNQLSLNNRNSKNFTTMQTPQKQNIFRNNQIQILNNGEEDGAASSSSTSTTIASSLSKMGAVVGCDNAFLEENNLRSLENSSITTSSSTSLQQQRNGSSTFSPDHASNNARCSTSCSQQAGNSAAASGDDVNIDELASYFDTFVHIPKKMSSMAEMMYI